GDRLGSRAIRDELVSMFSGHKSAGLALIWTLHLVAGHPEVDERVRSESMALNSDPPTSGDLPELAYARATIAEAIRLFPPIWILPRRTTRQHQLDGATMPRGPTVLVSPYL